MRGRGCRSQGRAAAAFAVVLVLGLVASPARALHKESPPAYRLTDGVSHPHPQTRSWGNWFAFTASDDLLHDGTTGQQIYYFNLALFDCHQGTTFATTPCPTSNANNGSGGGSGTGTDIQFLYRATHSSAAPDNPSLSLPVVQNGKLNRIGSGSPANAYICTPQQPGVPCTFTHWLAFDALGNFLGETDAAAGRRQIYIKNLWNQEIRRLTNGTDGDSIRPVIDAQGGVVTFQSTARLIPTSPTSAGVSQVFVYEVKSRLLRQLTFGSGPSTAPTCDQFCAEIAFQSTANLLGNGADTGVSQIFWARYDKTTHTSVLHQLTRGNGPSQHAYISELQPFIAFDSTATNLPGTAGGAGSSVYVTSPLEGDTQPPTFTQLTVPGAPNNFGDCSHPMIDAGSVADHVGFICSGDPLRNGTTGNRVFVFERSTNSLLQITGAGDVEPPIGGNLGSWFLTLSTTSPLGGARNCGYQLAFIDYLGTTQCCHDPKWIPATQIGQLTPDVLPASTGGGPPPSNLIGKQNFNFLAGDATTGAGSQAVVTTQDGASSIPLGATGVIPMVIGGADEFAHQASIIVPHTHVVLPAIAQADGTRICLFASQDGTGIIDCDGNNAGGDIHIAQFQNDVVSQGRQAVDLTGTFAAGGMRLSLPVLVNISLNPGNLGYCTKSVGEAFALPQDIPATLWLTTGTSETDVMDVDSTAGLNLTTTATGSPFNCGALQAGTMAGAELVGGIPFLAFPQQSPTLRDTIVGLRLQPVPDTATCRQACTLDSDCDDGNACNGVETCGAGGFCVPGTPMVCPGGDICQGFPHCDVATQACVPGTPCNDNNPCNGTETCDLVTGCHAGTPIDCSGQNACTTVNGAPAWVAGTCDPSTGFCGQATPVLCDDGNPCTDDSCDPVNGCSHVNNSGTCDDGNGCTTADTCINGICTGIVTVCDNANACDGFETCNPATGACLPGQPPVCDDGNTCTDDACDAQLGCLYVNNTNPCNDGSLCTTNDTCVDGVCTGIPRVCSDGNICNGQEFCNPLTGACQAGSPILCNDNNPCTDDTCDPTLGCLFSNNTRPCNDGSACTTNDTCSGGVCLGTPVACDDGNVCNGTEGCDALTGTCIPGTPLNCDDGNACTTDACDPTRGCVHTVTGTGTVCLLGSISAALAADNPNDLGGPRLYSRLVGKVNHIHTLLDRAAGTSSAPVAAKRYRAAVRALGGFQARVRKGIFRWNFDVTVSNQLIGQAGDLMDVLKPFVTR